MEASALNAKRRSTSAPGQFLGYSLQTSRLLGHLLKAGPGITVSLEVFADTGVEYPDGKILAEELKSRTSDANPLSDRSEDLWKTIRNWVDAVSAGVLNPRTTRFRLYSTRPFTGNFAERLHAAATQTAAIEVLAEIRSQLLVGELSSGDATPSTTGAQRHLQVIFSADPEIVAQIITNFELEQGSGHSIEDLKSALVTMLVPSELAEDVLYHSLGWIKGQIDTMIERGEPARVVWDDFHIVAGAVVRKFNCRSFLASVAGAPAASDVAEHLQLRTYVRQLSLIEIDDDEKVSAVADFIRAEAERVGWAAKGWVVENSFDEFELELISAWGNYKRRSDLSNAHHPEVDRGKMLYSDCFGHSAKLEGVDVPGHFCRGSFHKLSDDRAIGWHPRYSDCLDESPEEPDGDDAK